ncbi:heavy metal translocating P-type ATPase [soil metagenome]
MSTKTILSVEGMTCSSCAQGISRHLEKKGYHHVHVSYEDGEVEMELNEKIPLTNVIQEINSLGYKASDKLKTELKKEGSGLSKLQWHFLICVVFTVPLFLHMFIPFAFLHQPFVQFLLCLPVIITGMIHFGKSAWGSLKHGMPNMDVLISLGSLTAFFYSLAGWLFLKNTGGHYLFFETAATIITLLLLGNIIEQRSLKKTQSALEELTRMQAQTATKIFDALTDKEHTKEIAASSLQTNDLVLVNNGEKIPADGLVYWGTAVIDQSSMTGESMPVEVLENSQILAGTVIIDGSLKFIVQQAGTTTVLSTMIEMVKKSSQRKPAIQRAGDQFSAKFVPAVIGIAALTFIISFWIAHISLTQSLMSSIAVLVISCPCAMGLATPTAVAVGIGRAARNGILIKGGDTLERLSEINIVVFDKTGTLTKGNLEISDINYHGDQQLVHYLLGTLEQHSTHPIAKTLTQKFSNSVPPAGLQFSDIKEVKGKGIYATDKSGNKYIAGSFNAVSEYCNDDTHQVYLMMNNQLLATINFKDVLRDGSKETIQYFKEKGIRSILLSGDNLINCKKIAVELGIDEFHAGFLPTAKTTFIREMQQKNKVAMVGDGINDAPALAEAWVGISMGSGTQIAIQSADIVLLNHQNLTTLQNAHSLSIQTLKTIKQNLVWALLYNIVAIPVAALGFLNPMIASLSMAFSDVVVIGNSLRLRVKSIFGLR